MVPLLLNVMQELLDLTGQIFSRLTVLSFYPNNRRGRYWLCQCECGNKTIVRGGLLRNAQTRSCGCMQRDAASRSSFKHGMAGSLEHHSWCGMINRTTTKKVKGINRYIERNITVCDEWANSFEQFYKDMGAKPSSEYSIDRINNDGNYEPSNCRWATIIEQNNNKSTCVNIQIDGITRTATQWAEITGIDRNAIYRRIKDGWSPERAIMAPPRSRQY